MSKRLKNIVAAICAFSLAAALLPVAPHEAFAEEASDLFAGLMPGVDYVEGELVVSFKDDADSEIALLSDEAEEVTSDTLVLSLESDAEANEVAAELLAQDAVDYVEPNYLFTLFDSDFETTGEAVINDPIATSQWVLSDANANLYEFWDSYRANGDCTVAIIDSGIDSDHPDLKNNIVAQTSTVTASKDPDNASYEDIASNSHGTHVAGIIAAQTNNGLGVSGVSYNAKVMSVRAFYANGTTVTGSATDISSAVEYIVDNAEDYNVRVINMSLGATSADAFSQTLAAAIDKAWAKGILCVCASGNESSASAVSDAVFPANYEKTLCVGAIEASHNRFYASNGGDALQVVAPGTQICSTIKNGGYGSMSGTSMAAPYASAVAALCFLQNDALTPQNVIDALTSTATDLGTAGKDAEFGYGQVNPLAAVKACASGETLYRFYNPYDGDHLYTSSLAESDALTTAGWLAEDVAWVSPFSSKTPVYRLYNPYSGDHHYTTSATEYAACKAQGWNQEGVAWYSDDSKTAKVYRLFNPYVQKGTHHYTTNYAEYTARQDDGWRGEGVAWNALR